MHRHLQKTTTAMLTQALEDEQYHEVQAGALASIRRRRFSVHGKAPSSLELLREDRNR